MTKVPRTGRDIMLEIQWSMSVISMFLLEWVVFRINWVKLNLKTRSHSKLEDGEYGQLMFGRLKSPRIITIIVIMGLQRGKMSYAT